MSDVSLQLFHDALGAWSPGDDPAPLRHAAREHVGASRPVDVLIAEYAAAVESGNHAAAQEIAEELAPVRQAHAVLAGAMAGLETPDGLD